MFCDTAAFKHWFATRCNANTYKVTQIPLDALDEWSFHEDTTNLVHQSGQFFSIQGLDITNSGRAIDAWQQPIIVQPEHGILGILIKEFNGVPHCLLQAKMEPGNINLIQLSPTVQATKSNYTQVHGGRPVPYLEHFLAPRKGRILSDALQSEQASWFLAKRNRNMIVLIEDDIPVLDDFCWLTFDQIAELLHIDNLVNMDTRTVLSGAVALRPRPTRAPAESDSFTAALARSLTPGARAAHETTELLSWFTEAKTNATLTRRLIPLSKVKKWSAKDGVITHDDGQHFTILGVATEAPNREKANWTQPMLTPQSQGLIAFIARPIAGVLHLLVQARPETGALDRIEIAPTVQCQPADYPPTTQPPFLEEVLSAPPQQIRIDTLQSEEGGRFYHALNRYLLIETEENFPQQVPPQFTWMTVRQLAQFAQIGNHLNIETRTLLTLLAFQPTNNNPHTNRNLTPKP